MNSNHSCGCVKSSGCCGSQKDGGNSSKIQGAAFREQFDSINWGSKKERKSSRDGKRFVKAY